MSGAISSVDAATGAESDASVEAAIDGTTLAAGGESADGALANAVDAGLICSDPAPWSADADPSTAPSLCTDSPPWTTVGTPSVQITVDASAFGPPWNRFYETAVASDHANTLLCTVWGRNIQNALRKAHAQAGFQYVRFHGILDDDIGVYSEDASGEPLYNWARFDKVYDGIVAAAMRPIVEISFMPSALASDATQIQTQLWYGGASPNISPPKDWTKWKALMAAIVTHLEQRYGADEVRNHWYFEVWNEPSWMYSMGDSGYSTLYRLTVEGLLQGDPAVRVGGPAGSAGESVSLVPTLIGLAQAGGWKLDFVSYHRYGDNGTVELDANGMQAFHRTMVTTLKNSGYAGTLLNDEFGPGTASTPAWDTEASASFVAKTIHLIGTDAVFSPPWSYAYWAVSDLYEEINTSTATAYREFNYGLMLKGDPRFPESFDVAKPAFNALRLLHMMGDTQVSASGGSTTEGVNAAATVSADGSAIQILVYNHQSGPQVDPTQSTLVSVSVNNIPFAPGSVRLRHYIVDHNHANSHTAWVGMNSPGRPTQAQWTQLRDSAELCYYETTATISGNSWSVAFPQNNYGVTLLQLEK
jgi:xylan 1,4-beta-xylosidase